MHIFIALHKIVNCSLPRFCFCSRKKRWCNMCLLCESNQFLVNLQMNSLSSGRSPACLHRTSGLLDCNSLVGGWTICSLSLFNEILRNLFDWLYDYIWASDYYFLRRLHIICSIKMPDFGLLCCLSCWGFLFLSLYSVVQGYAPMIL